MKPYIRIYDRKETYFSYGMYQLNCDVPLNKGNYIKFLRGNNFLLRTGNFFSIYSINEKQLVINTFSAEFDKYMQSNNLYGKLIYLSLNTSDI
jgi:hypothetical protein